MRPKHITADTLKILARSDPRLFSEALKQFGLRIIGMQNTDPLNTRTRTEDIASIASEITEAVDDFHEISNRAMIARQIAEQTGYVVAIMEEEDEDEDESEDEEEDDDYENEFDDTRGPEMGPKPEAPLEPPGPHQYGKYNISHNPKPVPPHMAHDWDWAHDEFDGPEDPRSGFARSPEDAMRDIDEFEAERFGFDEPPEVRGRGPGMGMGNPGMDLGMGAEIGGPPDSGDPGFMDDEYDDPDYDIEYDDWDDDDDDLLPQL